MTLAVCESSVLVRDGVPLQILLVEDNVADVYLVKLALAEEQLDFDLEQVSDGEQALSLVGQFGKGQAPPDIVLLDLNLPRLEGDAVLRLFRASPGCHQVPVIVMTSSENARDRDVARRYDAVFFPKPPDLDGFLRLGKLVRSLCMRKAA